MLAGAGLAGLSGLWYDGPMSKPSPLPHSLAGILDLIGWRFLPAAWVNHHGGTSLMKMVRQSASWEIAGLGQEQRAPMVRTLVGAGADLHAQDDQGDTLLLYRENLVGWMEVLEQCGLDLTSPAQQEIHGKALLENLRNPHPDRVKIHLGNLHALLDAGLMPDPDSTTVWSVAALRQLGEETGDWADPIRLRIEAFHSHRSLDTTLPGAVCSVPSRKML